MSFGKGINPPGCSSAERFNPERQWQDEQSIVEAAHGCIPAPGAAASPCRCFCRAAKGVQGDIGTDPAPMCAYLGLGAPGIHGVLCIQGLRVLDPRSNKGIQQWDAAGAGPHRLQSPIPRFPQREGAHPIPLRSRWTPSAGSPGTKPGSEPLLNRLTRFP